MIKKPIKRSPLYVQIADNLREQIKVGHFETKRLPPERKLSQMYQVSQKTIRQALSVVENEGLLYRIPGKGTYCEQPIKIKKDFKKAAKNIGFLLCNRKKLDPYHSLIFAGVEKEAKRRGYNLLYTSVFTDLKGRKKGLKIPKMIHKNGVEGVIISGIIEPEFVSGIMGNGCPFVLLGHLAVKSNLEEQIDRVIVNSQEYAYKATKYLIELGHRKAGLINGSSHPWFANIEKGYKQCLQDFGLIYNSKLVVNCDNDQKSDGYTAMQKLLRLSEKPTAIFAANDRLAIGVMQAIKEKGLKIPDDISVIGIWDSDLARDAEPPLTSVRIPAEDIGRKGVGALIKRCKGKRGFPVTITVVSNEIIFRDTCKQRGH